MTYFDGKCTLSGGIPIKRSISVTTSKRNDYVTYVRRPRRRIATIVKNLNPPSGRLVPTLLILSIDPSTFV